MYIPDIYTIINHKHLYIMDTLSKYKKAQERVREIKDFYNHLGTFIVVCTLLFLINIYSSGFFWVVFAIGGWGIGILSHASKTFGWNPFFSKDWEKRKIQEYINRDDF